MTHQTRHTRAFGVAGVMSFIVGTVFLMGGVSSAAKPGPDPAHDGAQGVHALSHNADLNANQRGTAFADVRQGSCPTAPAGLPYAWHFVTSGTDTFVSLTVAFGSGTVTVSGADLNGVPSAKHAYLFTATATTVDDAVATVQTGSTDLPVKFQLSHVCGPTTPPGGGGGNPPGGGGGNPPGGGGGNPPGGGGGNPPGGGGGNPPVPPVPPVPPAPPAGVGGTPSGPATPVVTEETVSSGATPPAPATPVEDVEVLGSQTFGPGAAPALEALPMTGSGTTRLAMVGAAFMAFGSVLLLGSRRQAGARA